MRPFTFSSAPNIASAVNLRHKNSNSSFLAGGTNILDLMKEDVARPDQLIDIGKLDLTAITPLNKANSSVSLGALAKNTATANHPFIRQHYPLLTKAILAGASAQIRNMATNGGNLLQRTRCSYFYDIAMPCNKRAPGSGCAAMNGFNRMHAIFGWSDQCVAVFPSDMAVALAALDATVKVTRPEGAIRSIPFANFHRLPQANPEKDNTLDAAELITAIELPANRFSANSAYIKVRDRHSYAFALVSVAAGLTLEGDKILSANIAMGGVAHKPWRALRAEEMLKGKPATQENFRRAADAEMELAKPLEHNKFKVQMGKNTIIQALTLAFKGIAAKG
ncbi:MAG: xanthine dehydrogenase family protein subunit M [Pedobacter sp.]|nr:MAG: xanthine dehydrogenase family protein subunit M [Pedobacter sp.]